MKKKLTMMLGILTVITIAMTACAKVEPEATLEPQQSEIVSEEIQPKENQTEENNSEEVQIGETQQEENPIEVTASYISDEDIANLDETTTVMLGDVDQEYVSHVLIQVSTHVTDMVLWELSSDYTENGKESIKIVSKIAEATNVNTDSDVIVSVQENETLPRNGISFKDDAVGELHFMYISWSGEDGHPFLTEFSPDQKKLPE